MTIEAGTNTWVTLNLEQNKKFEDIEVSKFHEDKTSDIDDASNTNPGTAGTQSRLDNQTTEKTSKAISKMLGTNDQKHNATKANRIMKQKIQYMINTESVAEGLIELVDELKSIKSKQRAKLNSPLSKAKRERAGKDLLMSNVFNNGAQLL